MLDSVDVRRSYVGCTSDVRRMYVGHMFNVQMEWSHFLLTRYREMQTISEEKVLLTINIHDENNTVLLLRGSSQLYTQLKAFAKIKPAVSQSSWVRIPFKPTFFHAGFIFATA